jgi:hypothetical protein
VAGSGTISFAIYLGTSVTTFFSSTVGTFGITAASFTSVLLLLASLKAAAFLAAIACFVYSNLC